LRTSAPVELEVVEPPLAGRPPGYKIGDVGRYTLSANVEPREVPAGGSISVIAKLEGTGNVPFSLLVPEQNGVHFLDPQIVDQVAPKRGVVQGSRTFTYVVELSQPGDVDLGEITLPYYDAKARAYGVARAGLGKVKVTGSAKAAATAGAAATPGASGTGPTHLKGLITPPPKLGSVSGGASAPWPSRPGFWFLLIGLPLGTLLAFGLGDLAKLLRKRLHAQRGSLSTALGAARAELAETVRAGSTAAAASAAERTLFLGIEKGTGLKGRGILKERLAPTLAGAGVPQALAEQTARLLAHCDELRFAGEAADLTSFAAEVQDASQKLAALKPRALSGVAA
jgi:hypothetical protein